MQLIVQIGEDNKYNMDKVKERLGPLEVVNNNVFENAIKVYEECNDIGKIYLNKSVLIKKIMFSVLAGITINLCESFMRMKRCIQAKKRLVTILSNKLYE